MKKDNSLNQEGTQDIPPTFGVLLQFAPLQPEINPRALIRAEIERAMGIQPGGLPLDFS